MNTNQQTHGSKLMDWLENPEGNEPKMLIPKLQRINRKSNRLLDREAEKILKYLLPVEDVFLKCIKASEHTDDFTYEDIYNNFNQKWIEYCKIALGEVRPKYYLINNTYFRDKYKSKEG